MLGRLAVAPAGDEAFGGLWPGNFGGNMDAADAREGTTVYLPIFHDGAYFYFGDGHALQGDGEICGSGLETTMDVTFQFDVIKGRRIRWPRMEDADDIMVAASVRPLVDAFRIAQIELIEWLVEDYGFDKLDAYQVVSQGGHSRIANVVDPNYTIVAKFPKRLLPPRVQQKELELAAKGVESWISVTNTVSSSASPTNARSRGRSRRRRLRPVRGWR